jgi:hemoglobin-like flavoprotein
MLGDITPHVMRHFYAAMPEAKERFEFHNPVHREKLEGEMVEQSIYCLMQWHTSRSEIEIILATTVPHHMVALDISFEQFSGMIDSVCDVVAETIPAGQEAEHRAWSDLHRDMAAILLESV